jgi:plastocyanin
MKLRAIFLAGGLAAALSLTGCGGGGGGSTTGGEEGPATITIGTDKGTELKFVPDTVEAPANTPVELVFKNESTVPHNFQFTQGITAPTVDILQAGDSATIEFTTPAAGDYTFVCPIHPGMEGTLRVQ